MPQSSVVRETDRSSRPALDEAHDLVAPLGRQDEVGVLLVVGEQLVLVGGEAEEIGLLLGPLDRRALRLAAHAVRPDRRLLLVVEGLLAHGVPAGVLARG